MRIPPWLLAPFINIAYRAWCATLRVRQYGREPIDALEKAGRPMVFCLWHDEFFTLIHVRRSLKLIILVSQSKDGEYLSRLLESLGLHTARGSSSRGGARALLRAARLMRDQGFNACVTVDGPRGPRHEVKEGAVFLAMHTPAYLVPVRLYPRKAKLFSSWDRYQLPLPFSRVDIVFDQPYLPEKERITPENIERERMILQERLNGLYCPEIKDNEP